VSQAIWWAIGLVTGIGVTAVLMSCAAARPEVAEDAFTAQLVDCENRATTREQAKTCRDAVEKRWARDAGADVMVDR
jgi:hypothetical protein